MIKNEFSFKVELKSMPEFPVFSAKAKASNTKTEDGIKLSYEMLFVIEGCGDITQPHCNAAVVLRIKWLRMPMRIFNSNSAAHKWQKHPVY